MERQTARNNESAASRRVAALIVYATALLLAFLVVVATLRLLSPSDGMLANRTRVVDAFYPQGWSFFTRDPTEPELAMYIEADGNWRTHYTGGGASLENSMGLDRVTRARMRELGLITEELFEFDWVACDQKPEACLASIPSSGEVPSLPSMPGMCGEIGIVKQAPVPWTWREHADETVIPSTVARVSVRC